MGLGIYIRAAIPLAPNSHRRLGRDRLFAALREAVFESTGDPLLQRLQSTTQVHHSLLVTLHPAAEPLEFHWDPAGQVSARIKTSSCGPGFHAFVVDLLKSAGVRLGIDWDWRAEEGGDETGFALSRDFNHLQEQMAAFLKHLSQMVLDIRREKPRSLALNMPLGYGRIPAEGVITPLGPIPWSWFSQTLHAQGEALEQRARRFFTWWSADPTAMFWRKTGLAIAWTRLPYRLPVDKGEADLYATALACLTQARRMDERIDIPSGLVEEIQFLLSHRDDDAWKPPASRKIGYLRRVLARPTTGLWTIDLPGYYFCRYEDEGGEAVFWFDDRVIRVSSLQVAGPNAPDFDAAALVARYMQDEGEMIELDGNGIVGRANIQASSGQQAGFVLQGAAAFEGMIAIVTICWRQDQDRDWAIDTFRSISHPPRSRARGSEKQVQ